MSKKVLILALGLVLSVGKLWAGPEVSFSGYLDADMAAFTDFTTNTYVADQELDLTMDLKFNSKISSQLYFTSLTPGGVPAGQTPASARWTPLFFDGLTVTAAISDKLTLYMGDMVYYGGEFGYYFYKRPVQYAAIMTERFIRGAGADINFGEHTLSLYTGATDDIGNGTLSEYGALNISLGKMGSAKIMEDWTIGQDGTGATVWGLRAGLDADITAGPLGLNLVGGFADANASDASFTVLVEPSFSAGSFSVVGTYYQWIHSGSAKSLPVSVMEELFFYLEPGISMGKDLAFGLPIEWHDANFGTNSEDAGGVNADDAFLALVPTVYLYPTEDVEWWIWGGWSIETEGLTDKRDHEFSAGSEVIVNF